MSAFFKHRFKSKFERKEKIKEKFKPLSDENKKTRTKEKTIITLEEINELFDDTQSKKLLSTLNEEQETAALSENSHTLVIASAGTGKTSTIVARVIHLLKNNVHQKEIMLITFTSKAAQEMRERIKRYIPEKIAKEILIGTFHATAIILLKENKINFNLQTAHALSSLFASTYHKVLQSHSLEKPYLDKTLFELYSVFQAKGNGKSFSEWFKETYANREAQFCNLDFYEDTIAEHESIVKKENIVGFNELLKLAQENASIFKEYFQEIIIDEYQDTSYLQINYIRALKHERLFCVGDYDQSIYAFNGADIGIIAGFTSTYPNALIVNLSKNYRSQKPILDMAQKSIEHNERIYPKKLEITKLDETHEVKICGYTSTPDQYLEVAKMISESTVKFDDIAVLYRNNASADGMEMALSSFNIDVVREDKNSFLDIKEVRYMINLLKLTNTKEKLPLIEILNSFSLSSYSDMLVSELLTLSKNEKSIKEALLHPKGNYKFSASSTSDFNLSHPLFKKLNNSKIGNLFYEIYKMLASYNRLNIDSFLEEFFDSNLIRISMEKFAKDASLTKDGVVNQERYQEMLHRYKKWQISLLKTIAAFGNLDIFLKSIDQSKVKNKDKSGVNLLSVHGSKGLEFDEVYIIDMSDKKFPNRKLMDNGGGGIDEERRLFYVAQTRAKERLIITYSLLDGRGKETKQSQFLQELLTKEADGDIKKTKKKRTKKEQNNG
ncbi:MAG: ATP-dependent helicase [Campylobacterales bacterium]|nr:ATP-dependent helicase [Campylobacterales bacterium]